MRMTEFEPIVRLSKDLKDASVTLSKDEARFLVDSYYLMQNNRIRAGNQVHALTETGEPHEVLSWLSNNSKALENQIKRALDSYSAADSVGRWSRTVVGVGPVLAAGLLAHIDIQRAPTAGHIWSFAGLTNDTAWMGGQAAEKAAAMFCNVKERVKIDELLETAKHLNCSAKWLSRRVYRAGTGKDIRFRAINHEISDAEYAGMILRDVIFTRKHIVKALSKRPWNASLKTLCWKIGESFVKVCNKPDAVYGRIYSERKAAEELANSKLAFKDQAERKLETTKIGKATDAYKAYNQGMLPPAHIHARAKRYAVKMFLSHWHEIAYKEAFGEAPPKPYAIAIQGHAHKIDP